VRNLERGGWARESRPPKILPSKTLRGQQKDLLLERFLRKPERGRVSGKTWGRNFGKPLRREKP
jgi:hypothetical protein